MIYAENILLCIAIPLLIVLIFLRGKTRLFAGSFLVSMCMCLIAAYVSGYISLISDMSVEDVQVFVSPVIEELFKFLPILFYLVLFEPEDERVFLAGLGVGSGFATFENCCYILSSGAESLPYIMIRGMSVGVMHIVSVMALTIVIIMARRFKVLSIAAILGAISLSMIFHGLYNLLVSEPGISSYIGYILPILTALLLYLLVGRIRSADQVTKLKA